MIVECWFVCCMCRPAQGMTFDDDKERKSQKDDTIREYRQELERQMREKDAKKKRDKEERDRLVDYCHYV